VYLVTGACQTCVPLERNKPDQISSKFGNVTVFTATSTIVRSINYSTKLRIEAANNVL